MHNDARSFATCARNAVLFLLDQVLASLLSVFYCFVQLFNNSPCQIVVALRAFDTAFNDRGIHGVDSRRAFADRSN